MRHYYPIESAEAESRADFQQDPLTRHRPHLILLLILRPKLLPVLLRRIFRRTRAWTWPFLLMPLMLSESLVQIHSAVVAQLSATRNAVGNAGSLSVGRPLK